jgi:enamine deaminase RidA (YjgF/YER057c/UK114 family)
MKFKLTYLFLLLLVTISCKTRRSQANLKFVDVSPRGYSQSVEIINDNSKMIFISGQVPLNAEGDIVGLNDLEKQTEQVFENIKTLVEKSGGTMKDIVNIECYFTDISRIAAFRKARDKYIDRKNPPTSTAVQVERLVNPDFLIEINAVAVVNARLQNPL